MVLIAPLYITAPWGKTNQDEFVNSCIIVKTVLSPLMVFKEIKRIEKQIGRVKTEVWGPREIDIDLLLYNNDIICTEKLVVPHAQMQNRNFVLYPACDIASGWFHPVLKMPLATLKKQCKDKTIVVKCNK